MNKRILPRNVDTGFRIFYLRSRELIIFIVTTLIISSVCFFNLSMLSILIGLIINIISFMLLAEFKFKKKGYELIILTFFNKIKFHKVDFMKKNGDEKNVIKFINRDKKTKKPS